MDIEEFISHYESVSEAARELGVARATIYQWLEKSSDMPDPWQYKAKFLTGELVPDNKG